MKTGSDADAASKKRAGSVDLALEDSTIGGEWRNAFAVPKEEYGEAANECIMAYCIAICKWNMCDATTYNQTPASRLMCALTLGG